MGLESIFTIIYFILFPPDLPADKVRLIKLEVERLNKKYNHKVEPVDVKFTGFFSPSNTGVYMNKLFLNFIDISPELLTVLNEQKLIKVVRHEFAHAIVEQNYNVSDVHGDTFKEWANKLNGHAGESYSNKTTLSKVEYEKYQAHKYRGTFFQTMAYVVVGFLLLIAIDPIIQPLQIMIVYVLSFVA